MNVEVIKPDKKEMLDIDKAEYPIYAKNQREYALAFYQEEVAAVSEKTIGQYTGLKDKNGKMIFEGDIVKATWGFSGVVDYENFIYRKAEGEIDDDIEIIGNIHDNPELVNPK